MNRIDRLFAILLHLQHRRRVRASELARVFEVSERTIYRDMLALCESGVPIVALPGAGYELSEGYYLPPLIFTEAEAQALSLSARFFMSHTRGKLSDEAAQALAKITVVLPKRVRDEVERVAATISFNAPPMRSNFDDSRLTTLQHAIQHRQVVQLLYHSYSRNEQTEREIEPETLSYYNGAWYVSAYCRLRCAQRDFRLDRIDELTVLTQRFRPRARPDVAAASIVIRVRFAADVLRWVRERQHYAFQQEETAAIDGGTVMIYHVSALSEIQPWLLSWGASAVPLSPPELRDLVREEAEKMLNFLT